MRKKKAFELSFNSWTKIVLVKEYYHKNKNTAVHSSSMIAEQKHNLVLFYENDVNVWGTVANTLLCFIKKKKLTVNYC